MILIFEGCELDRARFVLRRDGREVRIEPQVYDLLCCLIDHRGEVVRKEELLDSVWGDRFVSESALTTRIKSLRQAVGDDGTKQRVIRTVHGKGYEFVADVQEAQLDRRRDEPLGKGQSLAKHQALPAALQPLIGRDELLADLVEAHRSHRLITLVGTGGVGKTSVGYELARRVADDYADGVFVVELVTVSNRAEMAGAFATALDVNMRQQASIEDTIVDMLRARRSIILVDNCEHVIEPTAELIDRILRSTPQVSIIATSREPLAISGEHVWNVEPLPTAEYDERSTDQRWSVPAVALFVERARAADPRFEPDDLVAPAIFEICRRLDGIPLAIELAASLASAIDVAEIAQRLNERFRLLKGVRRGTDPRHQTLNDTISWSYDLLSDDERRMFVSLAVFAGQFDLGAAESVCRGDDVLDLLTRLTRRSMLVVHRPASGGTHYEMLETLREYGRNRLDAQTSVELFGAHATQFTALARSVEIDLKTAREQDAVRRADRSFADLRAAQRFALQVEDFGDAFDLIHSIGEYAMRTLHYEVFAWADAATRLPSSDRHPLYPAVTALAGYGAWVRGEFVEALSLAHTSRAAADALDVTPTGLAERVLANVMYATGEIEAGMVEGQRLIELAESSNDSSRIAHAYYMHSIAASSIGVFDEAERLMRRARSAGQSTGSPTDLASSWAAQGFAAGDDVSALEAFATADRIAQSAGNRWMSAFARTESSGLLIQQGHLDAGCAGLAEVVDVWYRAGEWGQQWHTLSRCLIALDRTGQPEVAAEVLGAIEAHTTLGGPPVIVTLRDLAFETKDSLTSQLGTDRTELCRARGAARPVANLVDRTRRALLGKPID
jgi:predicted ATPase/DNA-binding winged helix-turn-helix (wHTH) protein